ncbi:hypothetical protein A2U01_0076022, partial [Trifolium medium]|nr:hypothetical protein [Trifolium medium]
HLMLFRFAVSRGVGRVANFMGFFGG